MKMNLYNQMFNPEYVNPENYRQIFNQRQYEFEQNKKVANAIKAMHDLCEAINKLDEQHKPLAFSGCLIEIAKANQW